MKLTTATPRLTFDPHERPGLFAAHHNLDTRIAAQSPVVTSLNAKPGTSPAEHEKKLRATAGKWVAQTFFGTLLKEVENSPFHSDVFEGGHGGQAFKQLLDQRLAEHMTRGAGAKLVNSIVGRLRMVGQPPGQSESASAARTNSDNPFAELNQHSDDRLRQASQTVKASRIPAPSSESR